MEKMLVGMKQLSVRQMRKETMKLLYRSACKTLQLKISSWNLTFSAISEGISKQVEAMKKW